jgi:hypothetical protein
MQHSDRDRNDNTTRRDNTTQPDSARDTMRGATPRADLLDCDIKTAAVLLDVLRVQEPPEVQQGWDSWVGTFENSYYFFFVPYC